MDKVASNRNRTMRALRMALVFALALVFWSSFKPECLAFAATMMDSGAAEGKVLTNLTVSGVDVTALKEADIQGASHPQDPLLVVVRKSDSSKLTSISAKDFASIAGGEATRIFTMFVGKNAQPAIVIGKGCSLSQILDKAGLPIEERTYQSGEQKGESKIDTIEFVNYAGASVKLDWSEFAKKTGEARSDVIVARESRVQDPNSQNGGAGNSSQDDVIKLLNNTRFRILFQQLEPNYIADADALRWIKDIIVTLKPEIHEIASVSATNAVYKGEAKLPGPKTLTVKDKNGKAVPASAYKVSVAYYKGHTGKGGIAGQGYAGTATVKVTGIKSKGYTGSAIAKFKVTTAADTKTKGAPITEKTLSGIVKYYTKDKGKPGYVGQADSKIMATIAKPRKKTMTVKWKAVAGATNYIVGYKRAAAKSWSYQMSGGKTEHTFPNMREGDLMEFRVAAYNGKKFARGEWTQINCRFYREMVSLKAAAGKGRIGLRWGKVAGATGYQVLVATKRDMSDQRVADVKGGSTTKATIKTFGGKALKAGKTYYVKMRAVKTATNVNGKKNKYIGIQTLKRVCKVR